MKAGAADGALSLDLAVAGTASATFADDRTATGTLSLDLAADGTAAKAGAAAGALPLALAADAAAGKAGEASGPLGLTLDAAGSAVKAGAASGPLGLTIAADGDAAKAAAVDGALPVSLADPRRDERGGAGRHFCRLAGGSFRARRFSCENGRGGRFDRVHHHRCRGRQQGRGGGRIVAAGSVAGRVYSAGR